MSLFRTGLGVLGLLLVATVLGSLMAGAADSVLGDAIVGTPLGPGSSAAPLAWTVLAGVGIYGVNEVRTS